MEELLEGVADRYGLRSYELGGSTEEPTVVVADPSRKGAVIYQIWFQTDLSGTTTVSQIRYLGRGRERKKFADFERDIRNWKLAPELARTA